MPTPVGIVGGHHSEQREVVLECGAVEGDEADESYVGVRRADGRHGDLGGQLLRDSRRSRSRWPGRRPRRRPRSSATARAPAVARGEHLGLVLRAAAPDRADGVDDEAGRQVEARRSRRPDRAGTHRWPGRLPVSDRRRRLGGWHRRRPPPPRRKRLAAFTTASTRSAVMSPWAASSRGATRTTPPWSRWPTTWNPGPV